MHVLLRTDALRVRSFLAVILTAASTGIAGPVAASDGPLQHALTAARCLRPQLDQVARQGPVTVYQARCSGTGNRVITLTCDPTRCRLEEPEAEDF